MFRFALPLLALVAFAAPELSAQALNLQMTAKIEKVTKPPAFAAKATHRARCTDVYLFAGKGVDLSTWEGKHVKLVGTPQVALGVVLEVTKVEASPHYLRISQATGGAFRIGEDVSFYTKTPFLSIVPWIMAGKPAFVPLQDYGSLTLDPLGLIYIRNDIALLGSVNIKVRIPNQKALVGAKIYQQGLYVSISLTQVITARLLNNDCFQIQAAK